MVLLLVIVLGATSAQAPPPATAFVDVSVLTMERPEILPHQTVIVRGDRIVEMGPTAEIKVPADARTVDGRGRYLLPGLADMHVHIAADGPASAAARTMFLAWGVTTVFNMSGTPAHLRMQQQIARGELPGPRVVTTGPIHNDSLLTFRDGERIAATEAAAGYQYIKVYNQLSRDAYWGIISAARRYGIGVVGHVVRGLDSTGLSRCEPTRIVCHCEHCLETTLTSGQSNIVHMEEVMYSHFNHHATKNRRPIAELLPEVPAVAERVARSGVWVTPTLEVFINIPRQLDSLEAILTRPEMRYLPAATRERWEPASNPYRRNFGPAAAAAFWEAAEFEKTLVKAFQQAGAGLLAGTDVGVPAVIPGISLHWELEHLVAAGLTPFEALVAATRNPATFLGLRREAGTVAVGKRADLLLLDANPLANIRNTNRRAGVMVRGQWLDRAELDRLLHELTTAN